MAQEAEIKTILARIREKSNDIPMNLKPELRNYYIQARVVELQGMMELSDALEDVGVAVPAILYGFIQSEIDRLKALTTDEQGGQ